jgi:hypothetical protein
MTFFMKVQFRDQTQCATIMIIAKLQTKIINSDFPFASHRQQQVLIEKREIFTIQVLARISSIQRPQGQ